MKALLPVCAGLAVITSITSVTFWRELRAERLANTELRAQLTEARIAARLPAMPSTASAAVAPAAASTAAAEAPGSAPAATPPKPPQQTAASTIEKSISLERDLMKNPEYRKLRLAQIRSNIERNYPGLAEELGLSEKEAAKLFDLLAEHQATQSMESQLLSLGSNPDQAAIQEMLKRQQVLQREQDDAVRALLGSRFPQWQEYQQTRPARTRVTSMSTQLAQAGLPLTEAQTKSLTTVMIAEQQQQRQEMQAMARNTAINTADPESRAKLMEETIKRNEDSNRRMLDAAAPHLSSRQLAALRTQLEQQAAMTRISLQMQMERERLQPQNLTQEVLVLPAVPIVQ